MKMYICYLILQYKNYEAVVVEHRAMKEKQRLKEEEERRENQIATRVHMHARMLVTV